MSFPHQTISIPDPTFWQNLARKLDELPERVFQKIQSQEDQQAQLDLENEWERIEAEWIKIRQAKQTLERRRKQLEEEEEQLRWQQGTSAVFIQDDDDEQIPQRWVPPADY